jgi:uncharacterized repeat protein (TIGR01451 family)
VNHAEIIGEGGVTATAEAPCQIVAPGLTLHKTGPKKRYLNREAEFDLDVANPGTAPATNVQVLDRLPNGLEFVKASEGGTYDQATRSVLWNLGTLAPSQRRGLQVTVLSKLPGDHVNRAFARADRNLEAKDEAPLHVEGLAALMLEVVDLDDPIEIGSETTFEVRVLNQGTGPCTNLHIVATLPAGMAPKGGTGPTTARIQGQQVVFDPLPRLAAHADITYRVKVLCQQAGDWRFHVEMSSDQAQVPVVEEESTRIYRD